MCIRDREEIAQTNNRLADVEQVLREQREFITVRGYARKNDLRIDSGSAGAIGIALKRVCEQLGVQRGLIEKPDGYTVFSYPYDMVDAVYHELEEAGRIEYY